MHSNFENKNVDIWVAHGSTENNMSTRKYSGTIKESNNLYLTLLDRDRTYYINLKYIVIIEIRTS